MRECGARAGTGHAPRYHVGMYRTAVFAAFFVACSSSGGGGGTSSSDAGDDVQAGDAGTDAAVDAPFDGGADAGPCGAGANLAKAVDAQQVASAPPGAMGGTIADGTYVLTDATLYTGPGGATGSLGLTLQQTWGFAGTAYHLVTKDGTTMKETAKGGTFTSVTAISIHLLQSCPDADFQSYEYTADAAKIVFYATDASGTLALTLTRR